MLRIADYTNLPQDGFNQCQIWPECPNPVPAGFENSKSGAPLII